VERKKNIVLEDKISSTGTWNRPKIQIRSKDTCVHNETNLSTRCETHPQDIKYSTRKQNSHSPSLSLKQWRMI